MLCKDLSHKVYIKKDYSELIHLLNKALKRIHMNK